MIIPFININRNSSALDNVSQKNLPFWILLLIPLSSVSFFSPFGTISPNDGKLIFLIITTLVGVWSLKYKNSNIPNFPKWGYFLLFLSFISSWYMSSYGHNQGFIVAAISIIPYIYSYGIIWILFRLDLPIDEIFKLIKILSILGIIIFLINYLSYPQLVFGVKEASIRGGKVRINIPFFILQVFMFYYYIQKISIPEYRTLKNIGYVLLYGIIIVMTLTRQAIAVGFGLGVLLYLYNSNSTKRFIGILVFSIIIVAVIPKTSIYKIMSNETKTEIKKTRGLSKNVRSRAWQFYVSDVQESSKYIICGNGIPALEKSNWGKKIEEKTKWKGDGTGWFVTDVGWAGFFFYFGVIGVTGLLIILLKSLIVANKQGRTWIAAWIMYVLITAVASGPIIYYNEILTISLVIYLIYAKNKGNLKYNLMLYSC